MATLKRRTSGTPNQTLRGRASAPLGELCFVHVTSVGWAREIIRAGQIETRDCRVFKRNLVYFFALRPAYKLKGSRDKRDILDFFPVVFLTKAADLGAPFHVYPFDTGGALEGEFDAGASPTVFLEDYALEETRQAISDHIAWAFGTPRGYYDGALVEGFAADLPDWDSGAITFAKIANLASEGHNQPDKRASAIEVAFERNVPLSQIEYAILPYQFLEDLKGRKNTEMITRLKDAGVEWATYAWRPNRAPEDFHAEIAQMVKEYLAKTARI